MTKEDLNNLNINVINKIIENCEVKIPDHSLNVLISDITKDEIFKDRFRVSYDLYKTSDVAKNVKIQKNKIMFITEKEYKTSEREFKINRVLDTKIENKFKLDF